MSHISIEILIKDKTLSIKIYNNLTDIPNSELIDIFCLISGFKILETKKGNEYDKA